MKDKTLYFIVTFFLVISAVLIVVAVHAVQNINRATKDADWVNHTHTVIAQIDALETTLTATQANTRAYAATGQPGDLAACNQALANITEHLELITALTRYEKDQQQNVSNITALVNKHTEGIQSILAAREDLHGSQVQVMLTTVLSGETLPQLRRHLKQLKEEELELLSERDTAAYLQAQSTRWTIWTGVILILVLLGGMVWLITDNLKSRRRATAILKTANQELEQRVEERTAELAETNRQLTTENLERQWSNQALEHQLRYNQNIVDSFTDLILVLTKSVNISRVNPAVLHMTRWDTTDLINQPLSKVLKLVATDGAEHEDLQHKAMRLMKEGRDLRDKSAELIDRNQKRVPVRFYLYPLRDDNKVIGAVAVLQLIHSEPESKG